ncbi:MAG: hypothetical protein ABL908_13645, partial [Hyphomicrobium sp.]
MKSAKPGAAAPSAKPRSKAVGTAAKRGSSTSRISGEGKVKAADTEVRSGRTSPVPAADVTEIFRR